MANQEQLAILQQGTDIWNAWRTQHPRVDVDLSRADLSGANLTVANLIYADLSRADLRHTDFSGANLSYTNLSYANLSYADLIGADLSYADLSYADLSGANLSGANLSGANLSRAKAWETLFNNLDLRQVKGLETIEHRGPSSIGTDTLERSQGEIPEAFLRGAGLSDPFIIYARSLVQQPIQYYTCFISYSSKDQDFAKRLYADLQSNGIRCWYAPHSMKPGTVIVREIDQAIQMYDKLLLVLSCNSVESTWVEFEVAAALDKEKQRHREALFPIRLDDTVLTTTQAWAAGIRRQRHIGDFTGWKDHDEYQKAFQRLMRDLQQDAKEQTP